MTAEPLARPLVRPLAPSESLFAAGGLCVGYSVRARGRLDLESLRAGFSVLRQTYPLLSCRMVDTGEGRTAFLDVEEPPLVLVEHGTRSGAPLPDIENRTVALHVQCEDAETTWVTLLVHHSVADGPHAMRLLADLWRYGTDIARGLVVQAHPQPHPRSLEQLLAERGVTADPMPALPVVPLSRLAPLEPTPTTVAHPRVELTVAETKALNGIGHEMGVTVNSLASAVLLRAVADTNGADVADLCLSYPVGLRRRLVPEVSATETTNAIGTAFFTPLPGISTLTLARMIGEKLAIDLAAGRVQRHYLNTPAFLGAVDAAFSHRPGTVLATNWGVIPELSVPDGVTLDDFRPVWHVSRPVGGSDIRALTPAHMAVVLMFKGRLIIEIAKFDPRPDDLTAHLRQRFDELLGTSSIPEAS